MIYRVVLSCRDVESLSTMIESPKQSSSLKKRDKKNQRKGIVASVTIAIFGRLPMALNRLIGGMIGNISWYCGNKTTQSSLANIQQCFPDKTDSEHRALAKASIISTAKTALEVSIIWTQPYEKLQRFVSGKQELNKIHQKIGQGKGVLLLAPHLGNWEILSPVLSRAFDFMVMFQPTGVEKIDELMIAGRTREGCHLAPTNRRGVSSVLKQLKEGKLAAILPDQVPEENSGELAPFFGKDALTMTLAHKLIQRTNCSVLMIFAKQVSSGFEIVIKEPDPDIYDSDPAKSLTAMNRSVEECVLEVPGQYQWEYKRFKRAP